MTPIDIINGLIGIDAKSLTPLQRQVQLMMEFHADVVNGGWDQYLLNSAGDGADEIRKIAPKRGFAGIATAMEWIASRMGGEIPTDRGVREPLMEQLLKTMTEAENKHVWDLIDRDLDGFFEAMYDIVERNVDELSRSHYSLRSNFST